MIKFYCLTLLFFCSFILSAQENTDTLRISISSQHLAAQKNYLPHYAFSNRYGVFDLDDNISSILRGEVALSYSLAEKMNIEFGGEGILKFVYNKKGDDSYFLQQGYSSISYDFLKLTIGKKNRTVGTHSDELSSGSLAISKNAQPIPQILLEVEDYTNVPFTKGFLQFKGSYAHGWFNDERFINKPLLHEKSFYLQYGSKYKLKAYTGLVHFVVWGGEHPSEGKIPATFKDYLRVITSRNAESIPDTNKNVIGEQLNALGDNLGILDLGASLSLNEIDIEVYYQIPYEDWSGTRFYRNKDQLLGLQLKNKSDKIPFIESFNYEYFDTKYQSGPGLTDPRKDDFDNFGYGYGGRDNYYNNYLYRSGWTYKNHIIGTPLFFTKQRAQAYIAGFEDPDINSFDFNIVNNRVQAHHFGFKGRVIPQLEYKLLATITKNYGTYGGLNGGIQKWESKTNPEYEYEFAPPLRQYYFMLENRWNINSSLYVFSSLSVDRGTLSNNFSGSLGLSWNMGVSIN